MWGAGRVGSSGRLESRTGCAGTRKAAFFMVEATPRRRVCDLWSVKTWILVMGIMLLSCSCGVVRYSRPFSNYLFNQLVLGDAESVGCGKHTFARSAKK